MKELARKKKKEEKREHRRELAEAKREQTDTVPVEGEPEAEQE